MPGHRNSSFQVSNEEDVPFPVMNGTRVVLSMKEMEKLQLISTRFAIPLLQMENIPLISLKPGKSGHRSEIIGMFSR
jgi:hypothetical protein